MHLHMHAYSFTDVEERCDMSFTCMQTLAHAQTTIIIISAPELLLVVVAVNTLTSALVDAVKSKLLRVVLDLSGEMGGGA